MLFRCIGNEISRLVPTASTDHNRYAQCGQPTGSGLVPPVCRMVGGWSLGKASPYRAEAQFGSFPLDAGRSRGHRTGGRGSLEARSSRVHRSCPTHPPVAALLPLGGALGWFPAVAPMARKASREPLGQEGDKSEEAVPWPIVDVQPCANWLGYG